MERPASPSGSRAATAVIVALVAIGAVVVWAVCVSMPGESPRGFPEPIAAERATAARMRADLDVLAGRIGKRNTRKPDALPERRRS